MNKILRYLVAIVLALAGPGLAQVRGAEEIVHTVDFPKGDAAWSVSFEVASQSQLPKKPSQSLKTSPEAKPPPPQRKRIDIVRKGDLRHDIVSWSDKSVTEYWWTKGPLPFVLFEEKAKERVSIMKAGNMGDYRFDVSLFAWVGKQTFMEMESYKEKKCRYYEIEVPLPDDTIEVRQAWIDNETSRPVAYSNSGIRIIFSFDAPLPSEPLVMPGKFQDELKRIQAFFVFKRRTPADGY